VVPGMVTQFKFTPTATSEDYKSTEFMNRKVRKINEIRRQKNEETARTASDAEILDPYEFEYYLLCNKICGASHYNMQMKMVVETEEEFNTWLSTLETFEIKIAATATTE